MSEGAPSGRRARFPVQFATLNGVRQAYFDVGEGPPLLCLHGWPEHGFCWWRLADELARDHRVVALDFRGCGDSETVPSGFDKKTLAADAGALLDHLGLPGAIVVGHDWGAPVAYRLALDRPEMVPGLVILNGRMPLLPQHIDLMFTPQQVRERWYFFLNLVPDLPETLIGRSLEEYFGYLIRHWGGARPSHDAEAVAEMVRANGRPDGMRGGLGFYRTAVAEDVADWKEHAGRTVEVPNLVLWGARDPVLPPIYLDGLESVTPDLEVHLHEEAGHYVQEEEPAWCAGRIRDFVARRFA